MGHHIVVSNNVESANMGHHIVVSKVKSPNMGCIVFYLVTLVAIFVVATSIFLSPAMITLGTGLGISFGIRKFRSLHLSAKILIPIVLSVVVFIAEIFVVSFIDYANKKHKYKKDLMNSTTTD